MNIGHFAFQGESDAGVTKEEGDRNKWWERLFTHTWGLLLRDFIKNNKCKSGWNERVRDRVCKTETERERWEKKHKWSHACGMKHTPAPLIYPREVRRPFEWMSNINFWKGWGRDEKNSSPERMTGTRPNHKGTLPFCAHPRARAQKALGHTSPAENRNEGGLVHKGFIGIL